MLFPDEALFEDALTNLAEAIVAHPAPPILPLACDRYVARSCLQKAIRRGEPILAQKALANVFLHDRRSAWRALTIIALEDVGVSNVDLIAKIIAAYRDRPWRVRMGGDWPVLDELTRQMADSLHCQAACDLLLRATNDPSLEHARAAALDLPPGELAVKLWNGGTAILDRGVTALAMGGVLAEGQRQSEACGVFDIFAETNRSTYVVATCRAAWKLSRNPMAILLPLIWEQWHDADHQVSSDKLSPVQMIDGVPGYALDQFTRIGNSVARALLTADRELRQIMTDAGVPTGQQPRAVNDLLFIREGGLLTKRLVWGVGDQLRLPERQLPAVIKLAGHLPRAVAHLELKARHIALLRRQQFHPGRV
jgi:hypothetical protein